MEVYCVALVVHLILTLVASRLLEAFGKKLGAEPLPRCPAPTRRKTRRITAADTATTALRQPCKTSRLSASRAWCKSFGSPEVPGGIDLSVNPGEVVTIIGARLGQVDVSALPQPARDPGRASHLVPRPGTSRPSAAISINCARTSAWCSRASTCSTTWTCSTTARRARHAQKEEQGRGREGRDSI